MNCPTHGGRTTDVDYPDCPGCWRDTLVFLRSQLTAANERIRELEEELLAADKLAARFPKLLYPDEKFPELDAYLRLRAHHPTTQRAPIAT